MKKMSKAQNVKIVSAITVSFLLIFSFMVASAANTPVSGASIETTAVVTPDGREIPAMPVADSIVKNDGDANADLDKKMEEALTAVKKIFEIDEKTYPSFNYNYNPGDGQYSVESWYFNWYSNDGRATVYASVSGDGNIINYGKYNYTDNYYSQNVKFAELSKADAKAKADEFLKKVFGKEFDGYRAYYQNLSYPSDRYNIYYVLTKNGYDYANYTLYVDVDKFNGEILNFSRNDYPLYSAKNSDFNYQDASKIIKKDDALKAYLDKIGVELVYMSNYDWNTKKLTVQPVYRLKNTYDEYISAVNGSLVKIDNTDYYGPAPAMLDTAKNSIAYNVGMYYANAESAGGVSFTQAELSEMAKTKGYITADEAIEIMIKTFDLELGDLSAYQKNTSLNADSINQEQYLWSIYLYGNTDGKYENYSASIDASNGNIISYYGYSNSLDSYGYYDYNGDGKIDYPEGVSEPKFLHTYDEAKKIVWDKIKELSPYDIDKNFELVEYPNIYMPKSGDTKKSDYYSFYLVRKVNGIKFESNAISVSFDNINGKITNYYISWYENAEFPKLDKVISAEKALSSIDAFSEYKINYISNGTDKNGKTNAVLVYRFDNTTMVDPFTGKCIGWDLKEMQLSGSEPNYKDLKGHESEKIINTLTDNGIYVWGGEKFDPDKAITKGELLTYLRFYLYNSYYFTESTSSFFISNQSYYRNTDGSLNENLDKVLTKQEAMKIICELAGYGELGKHSEIFVYPFKDGKCDEEYEGYVAILKAFGIISGDKDGNFNASETLTRAEAAELIYNIIMSFNATANNK